MKVLMLSIDKKIFEKGSDVQNRMVEYGQLFDELHIIVFSRRNKNIEYRISNKIKLSDNVFVYPTNSISRLLYIIDAVKIGKKIIPNSKFKIQDSVITCQDPFETGIVGWLIARKFHIRLQLQVHTDFLSAYFVKHSVFNINKIRVMIAKFLLPKADCIRVVSNRIKDSIMSKFKIQNSKFYSLPIFVDIEKIKNTLVTTDLHKKYPQFEKIVLMVSRLEKEKNIQLAISAFKDAVKKYPRSNLGLIIVGDGSQRKVLEAQNSKFKIQDSVIFDGWQEKQTIYSYYKTADLLLVTSDYEGYGMTIIEALATGLPVLSTDVGVAREAGAQITERDSVAENIVKYIENSPISRVALDMEYMYKNKQDYLEKFKESFICKKKK